MKALHGAAKRIFGTLQSYLSKKAKFGKSKHQAKADAKEAYLKEHENLVGYNPSRVDGIYSIKTMESYREAMRPFAVCLSEHGVKNARQITEDLAGDYLRERQSMGLSAYTVSRDLAAINKALNYRLDKKGLGLNYRHRANITRSRLPTENDRRKFKHDQEQMTFARGTGIRRASMTTITPGDCVRNRSGQVVGVRVVEKGGKERVAPVLNAYKERLTAIVDGAGEPSKPIFDHYDSHIDNHHFRAEYCAALLKQLEEEHAQGKPWFGGDLRSESYIHLRGRDKTVGDTYRGHPTQIVAAVSGAMGHNRLEIIFSHYLYAAEIIT